MEVKINKDIREYTEAVFFGMSLRQCVFSGIACGAAAGSFLLTKPMLGMETASWICVLSAFPFILMGFVRYNGLTFEKFLLAWFRSEVLMPRHLVLRNSNLYGQILGPVITELHKEDLKKGPANKHKPKQKQNRRRDQKARTDRKARADRKERDWTEEDPGLTEEEIDYEKGEADIGEPEGFEIDHDMTYYEWLEAKKRWEEKKRMEKKQREQGQQGENQSKQHVNEMRKAESRRRKKRKEGYE